MFYLHELLFLAFTFYKTRFVKRATYEKQTKNNLKYPLKYVKILVPCLKSLSGKRFHCDNLFLIWVLHDIVVDQVTITLPSPSRLCLCRVFKGKQFDKQMKQKPAWSIEKHRVNLENVSQGWSVCLSLSLCLSSSTACRFKLSCRACASSISVSLSLSLLIYLFMRHKKDELKQHRNENRNPNQRTIVASPTLLLQLKSLGMRPRRWRQLRVFLGSRANKNNNKNKS